MPFGLKNALYIFRTAIDIIMSSMRYQSAVIYLNDIVFFSKTVKQHSSRLRRSPTILQYAGVTLKLKKCSFITETVDYIPHLILFGRLEIA